jgi:hypothetical protein
MKFRQIVLLAGTQGNATQGIGLTDEGVAVWLSVREDNQLPAGMLRNLEVRALKIIDKREPMPTTGVG